MIQEDKDLLFKDICARLPYGVKCNAFLKEIDGSLKSIFGTFKGYNGWATVGNNLVDIETVRPYLRSMSSMTEEQRQELESLMEVTTVPAWGEILSPTTEYYDWLNKNHFDYRGLIEKGLAIDATGQNIY